MREIKELGLSTLKVLSHATSKYKYHTDICMYIHTYMYVYAMYMYTYTHSTHMLFSLVVYGFNIII